MFQEIYTLAYAYFLILLSVGIALGGQHYFQCWNKTNSVVFAFNINWDRII